ncbi:hypothetical protein HNO89_001677 [Sporosarcina luteola]|nr:hypothetical protein [Sporosarcina luteola]
MTSMRLKASIGAGSHLRLIEKQDGTIAPVLFLACVKFLFLVFQAKKDRPPFWQPDRNIAGWLISLRRN